MLIFKEKTVSIKTINHYTERGYK